MLQGKYFSKFLSTVQAEEDLVSKMKTELGINKLIIKKMTLISSAAITIDINNTGVYSDLFQDIDGYSKLSLSEQDVVVISLKVKEPSISDIFFAIVY